MPPIRNNPKNSLNPWIYFLFFFSLIALLSWPPYSVWTRIICFPLGLLFLTYIGWKRNPSRSPEKGVLFLEDFLSPWRPSLWLGLLAAALFFRFYHLVSLHVWPLWDDADLSSYAIRLSENWQWKWSFGPQKLTPLFTFLQGLFFKLFQPSLESMWLYPALGSLSVIPAAYFASRQFASRSFSILFTLLMGLSFPAFYWGRFCLGGSMSLSWQLVLWGTLGWSLKGTARPYRALVLGTFCAIGLYVSFLLSVTFFMVSGIFIRFCNLKGRRGIMPFLFFLSGSLLPALPLLIWVFPDIIRGHLAAHILGNGDPVSWLHQFTVFFSYPTAFFFGTLDRSYWNFGPLWGGLLNPLLGSCFFLGLAEFKDLSKKNVEKTILLGIALCLIPLLGVSMVECFRTLQMLPFVIWIVTLGAVSLYQKMDPRSRSFFPLLLLILSMALDGYHLFGPYHQWSLNQAMTPGLAIKSPERYKAFQILEQESRREGPGLVYGDFVSDIYDQSLLVSTYPFNAARNPRLNPRQAQWAGILCDLHYEAPLHTRFPKAQFFLLSDPHSKDAPIWTLALIQLEPGTESGTIRSWVGVHRKLQDLYEMMPYHVKNPDFGHVLRQLYSQFPSCEKDPLLKAWLEEKMLDILLVNRDVTGGLWFLEKPIEETRSFPFIDGKFAYLYHRLGLALVKDENFSKARESFTRASKFDPKYDLKRFLALCR